MRDDIYLTIASIADFQPYVTAGVVPPPANPLTISQPCIRLNDLDSVGRSGRHLTLFEMMAHHAFNSDIEEIYWKDRTLELCEQFIASIGGDLDKVTYKEHPWIGGGNAGPSLEVLIGGLEVATLVFMNLGRNKSGKPGVDLNGENYYPMKNYIVDTGKGLNGLSGPRRALRPSTMRSSLRWSPGSWNRRAWTYAGQRRIHQNSLLSAKFAGVMDIPGTNLYQLRKKVATAIDVPIERLDKIITPIEKVYWWSFPPGASRTCWGTLSCPRTCVKATSPGWCSGGRSE